jgi:two-component system, NtrC family, response regulator AtoC
MAKKRILVVDDEKNMQVVLKLLFDGEGYEARCVSDGAEALAALEASQDQEGYSVVVSDFKMNRLDGMGLLRTMRERKIYVPFVLVTAYGTVEKAVEAMKLGAVDVITKPFAKEALLAVVAKAISQSALAPEDFSRGMDVTEGIVYYSPAMAEIGRLIERIGTASAPVLLMGESGTGKEVLARAIHRAYSGGDFDARPFVSVNCPAVPESLLESELFGYRKGAFTGADQDFRGKVEMADGGTLFLDEIGDLPTAIQPKLLRLLENRTFEPLGSGQTKRIDIRVICATNRNLAKLVAESRFREDLLYRINTFTVELPPLRERREDIAPLAEFFLKRFALETRKNIAGFSPKAAEYIASYSWPGNVRELKNVVERATILCGGAEIQSEDLPPELRRACSRPSEAASTGAGAAGTGAAPAGASGRPGANGTSPGTNGTSSTIDDAERALIVDALERSLGNISAAARILGVTRNTLRYRIRKYGL